MREDSRHRLSLMPAQLGTASSSTAHCLPHGEGCNVLPKMRMQHDEKMFMNSAQQRRMKEVWCRAGVREQEGRGVKSRCPACHVLHAHTTERKELRGRGRKRCTVRASPILSFLLPSCVQSRTVLFAEALKIKCHNV